jgi:disulfide bond formation protein DsbB
MRHVTSFLRKNSVDLAFLAALFSTAASLFTSRMLGWSPCTLCVLQRIFMYPLTITLAVYMFYKRKALYYASLGLTVLGMPTAFYHHVLVRFDPTRGCGFAIPCSMDYQFNLGIFALRPMHIPLSAFTAFAIITFLLWRYRPVSQH